MGGGSPALQRELVELRRALHRAPETGLHTPQTQERVLAALEGLPLEVTVGQALSSVVAVLRGTDARGRRAPGDPHQRPVVLLRADVDALPVTEAAELSYASTAPGTMHACGHDLHTAMLVGAAHLLAANRHRLPGDIVLAFQPGEEVHEGARLMVDEGLLEAAGPAAAAAYAVHVVADMPRGVFVTRRGTLLAGADTLHVTVRGTGGHASSPHRAGDPVPAACEMVTALEAWTARRGDALDPVVATVGTLAAGTAANVVPTEAHLAATVRTLTSAAREQVTAELMTLVEGIGAARGLSVEARLGTRCPPTVNDPTEAELVATTVRRSHGATRFAWADGPVMAAEDLAHVLARVPGALVFLGACPPDRDPDGAAGNHAPGAVFDDTVLADGAALLAELALRRLRAGATG